MKGIRLIALLVALFISTWSCAAEWYLDAAEPMGRLEPLNSTSFWLMRPNSNPTSVTYTATNGNTCLVSQLQFIAPNAEIRAEWYGMVLSAVIAGRKIAVYGTCQNPTTTLNVSRVILDFKD